MESVGSLIDRLTVTNLKLWFVQEKVHEAGCGATFPAPEANETLRRLYVLNQQRTALVNEINDRLGDRASESIKL